jgi:hypothetical protein
MDFVYGLLGFVAFETLKIYNRLWSRKTIIPSNHKAYFTTVVILAIFAGAAAHGLAGGSVLRALIFGFSVPSGLKAIVETSRAHAFRREDLVDDVELRKPNTLGRFVAWLDDFFRFV